MAPVTVALTAAPAVFHCTQCAQFLPLSQFYKSNVRHSIHRCRKHTCIAALASRRNALSKLSPERKAALRVVARMSKVASAPAWTRVLSAVEGVLRRFDCRSVLSGRARGLVLVRATGTGTAAAAVESRWQAWEGVPVTQGEAVMLATQTGAQREALLCRGALGEAVQAARQQCDDCQRAAT